MPDRLSTIKGYVRMSWHPSNLYNLQRLSYDPPAHIGQKLSFKRTSLTLFQQKWSSKRLLRAYHGDFLQERVFRRRFLPNGLPALEVKRSNSNNARDASTLSGDNDPARIPLGSMMWRELEARLDVLVFRACFAHSVYEARRLVTQGHVKLNGKKMTDPNILLEPGDIFSVDPKEMYLLRSSDQPFEKQKLGGASTESEASESEEGASSEEASSSNSETVEAGTNETQAAESSSEASTSQVQDSASSTSSVPSSSKTSSKSAKSPSSSSTRKALPGLPFSLPDYSAPFIFLPAYLEVSFPTCSCIYVRHPTARSGYSEIPSPYEADGEVMRLGWEFYKGVGRRRRGTEDWGDNATTASSGAEQGVQYDERGRRKWASDWEELNDEKRKMRGVRQGRGKWANRPL